MRIPGADEAIIPAAKLRDYLLNQDHPNGRTKASFFTRLGYGPDLWELLERDLRQHHLSSDAAVEESSPFGKVYVIVAPLHGPSGSSEVRSVWQIDTDADVPRLITAYPGGRR